MWYTEIERLGSRVSIPLRFGPKQVDWVDIVGETDGSKFDAQKEVYISVDPAETDKYYTLAIYELSLNVAQGIKREPVAACSREHEKCTDRPVLSCDNNNGEPIVELVLDEKAGVELDGNCITIHGKEFGLVRAVDRLLYKWYSIMK